MVQYFPSLIVPAVVGLFTIPIVTRLFPADTYGNYVLVIVTIAIFTNVAGWVTMSIVRFYPEYDNEYKLDLFYSTVLKLACGSILVLSILFLLLLIALDEVFSSELYNLMKIGIVVFIPLALFTVFQEFLRASRRIHWYSVFSAWKSLAPLVIGLALILIYNYDIQGLLWGSVIALTLTLPLLWKISIKTSPVFNHAISIQLTSNIAKYGLPLVVGNIAAWTLSLSDRYILLLLVGSHQVGVYSASYAISEASILLLVSLFRVVAWPIAVNLWENNDLDQSKHFLTNMTRYYLILSVPAVLGLSVLSKPAIAILTATNYWEGYKIVPIVTTSIFFLGLSQIFGFAFGYYKKTSLFMFCTVSAAFSNIILNFLLIPTYNYLGAAIGTLISYILLLLLTVIVSRQYYVWTFPFKTLIKSLLSSALMGLSVNYIYNFLDIKMLHRLITCILLATIIYLFLLFLLREFKLRDFINLISSRSSTINIQY